MTPSPPQRVVAIKSTSIEMMLALGLRDRIVGVGFADGPYADAWAPADPPPVLSDRVPSQEAVLALAPDLVYAGWESNLTADGAGDRATLARLGTATLVSPSACREAALRPDPLTWNDLWAEISLVGDVFGVPDRAGDLVADEKARLAAVAPDGRGLTALWYSSGSDVPYVGAGTGSTSSTGSTKTTPTTRSAASPRTRARTPTRTSSSRCLRRRRKRS